MNRRRLAQDAPLFSAAELICFFQQLPLLSISMSYVKKMLLPRDRDTPFLIARFLIAIGRGVIWLLDVILPA